MRKSIFFSPVLTLFLLVPASITWAQTISSQKGLTTAIFPTNYGNIKVYLPDDIRPGDIISGSILAEPFGKNSKQIEKNLSELGKYNIVINDRKIIVPSKQKNFDWVVSLDQQLTSPMELMHVSGYKAMQLTLKFNLNPTILSSFKNCIIPSHALTGSPLRITGSFDGNSSNTNCSLNGRACEIIAESPRMSFIQFPGNSNGVQTLNIQENNQPQCSQQVSSVEMNVSSGKLNLRKGERTYIHVAITGLQNLPDTALLTLVNLSADVVAMQPANTVIIPLPPDSMGSGFFDKRFEIQSLKTGTFNVNVNLDLPESSGAAVYFFDLRELKNESGYPGSYGYKGDQPCEPEGATIKWRWHKTFACEISERKVLPCGHSKEGNEVYEKIKELLEELELDKATDIGEKMSKAFSTAKSFSYSIHVIRKWVDYDIEYKCVNGKWQPVGGVFVKAYFDDLGWHSVKHLSTVCWLTFDSPAAEKEFEEALETALRAACK